MQNLSGNKEWDLIIEQELSRAGITAVRGERSLNQVPASVTGTLGPFTFARAWYYWVVDGPVPFAMAEELYADPVGKTDVRINGSSGGIPLRESLAFWQMPDGRAVLPIRNEAEYRECAEKGKDGISLDDYVFSDDPKSVGAKGVICTYHIDTEVGLRLFADMAKKHVL